MLFVNLCIWLMVCHQFLPMSYWHHTSNYASKFAENIKSKLAKNENEDMEVEVVVCSLSL